MKIIKICIFVSLLVPSSGMADEMYSVFVSVIPQKYFVEKIAGNLAEVSVMVEPGAGPATYEPKPAQMARLSKAVLYFSIGVPFENAWLARFAAANPDMEIIRCQEGIEKLPMAAHHHEEEDKTGERDPHGEYEGIRDPHIWLSPPLVMVQARNILSALLRTDPEHAAVYEGNYRQFIQEIAELDMKLLGIFREKQAERSGFMVFHPAWGYFATAYGLKQVPVELEGKEPKAAELQELIQWGKKEKIRAVFVQPQYSAKSARVIAGAIGGQVIIADPLAADWPENLRQTALKFREALQ